MSQKLRFIFIIAAIVLVCDQVTKWWVVAHMPFGTEWQIHPAFFSLVHYRNKGAAFGFLSGWDSQFRDIFFYVLAFLALGLLFSLVKQVPDDRKAKVLPIALIFGGALGNILDRIFRGSVVDFLLVHWDNQHVSWSLGTFSLDFDLIWPAFNVADSAITVGVVCLMIQMLTEPKKEALDTH